MAKTRGRRGSGPRGEFDRAGFQERVAETAERLVRAEGLRALGMRRLAAEIGYAPNSIYNAVGDLDQVVLLVNTRTLGRLHDALAAALVPEAEPLANALALVDAYLAFVAADPGVWSLVHEYAMAPEAPALGVYGEALARAIGLVETVLAPLLPDPEERRRIVAALWAALHGLAALSTTAKLATLTPEPPGALARLLVLRVLGGPERPGLAQDGTPAPGPA